MKAVHLILRAVKNQKVAAVVALLVAGLCIVVGNLFHYALVGVFAAIGVGLGFANTVGTEASMIRMLDRGEDLSRRAYGFSSLGRLAVVTAGAVVVAIAFWPDGVGAFFGLAVYQPLALVLMGLPVLRELRKDGGHE